MNNSREALLLRLKSLHEPIAVPTVQTMDMGLEHEAASSEGAAATLGRYGSWPVLGPFSLKDEDIRRLQQIQNEKPENISFDGMEIEFVWHEVEEMFECYEIDESETLSFRRDFISTMLEQSFSSDDEFYVFFHKHEADLPLFFRSRRLIIEYFMSMEDLTPWDEMSTEELEMWDKTLSENAEFMIVSPVEIEGDQ